MATNTPKGAASHKADLMVIGILSAIYLVPWALLTAATKVAGGNPQYSPFDVLGHIADNYRADNQQIVIPHLVGAFGNLNYVLFWGFLVLLLAAVAGGFAFFMMYWKGGIPAFGASRFFAPRSLQRSSRWANYVDLKTMRVSGPTPGRMILGRRGPSLFATEREVSTLVIGPTRSGKTSGLVVPNLFEWYGAAIVTSTKSELVDITGGYRQSIGPVYVYDPTGEISDNYQTVTWSPIAGCDKLDYAIMVAAWLTAGMNQAGSGKSDNDWAHWAESGKQLIAPLLFVAASTGQHSIVDVKQWVQSYDLNTPLSILQEMLSREEHPENSDPERAISMIMGIDQRPEKERGTVFSTVSRFFNLFNEGPVARSAMTSRLDPEDFIKRRGTLYLCTPRQSPERVASLFVGILMTIVTHAYGMANFMPRGRLDPELGLFLDELANVVPIEELPSMASQGAGRGVILMSIVQDFSQLRARYGNDKANSILNNHPCKIVLPGISDPETTEIVAKMVGKQDYTDVSVQHNDGKTSKTYAQRSDQMATPDALRQLQDGCGIVLYRGKPPTIVRLRPWFSDKHFTELAKRRFFKNADYVSYKAS